MVTAMVEADVCPPCRSEMGRFMAGVEEKVGEDRLITYESAEIHS